MTLDETQNGHQDSLVRATAADGFIRCMSAVTTKTVADAARRHGTSGTVTAALGRTLTGALLLGAGQKEFDRLTVRVECDGPVRGITRCAATCASRWPTRRSTRRANST
jgi:redox-regulated HSP33 family molecular chaperone